MKDTDIIKALECCENLICKDCPYLHKDLCGDTVRDDALALINRQNAEIERLREGRYKWRKDNDR